MRIGSLFSGAGMLDYAVRAVFGGEVAWHCENDAAASKVLAARWPGVPNHHDITAVDWVQVEPVGILCGGYPCQPFSSAGQRKGANDERHLWPYFAEAIRRVRPRYVVLENVAGHRSMGFDSVLADLASMRYDAQWCSLRAADVGAPHGRDRIFVIAHPAVRSEHWEWSRPTVSRTGDSATTDTAIESGCIGNGNDVRARGDEGRLASDTGRSGHAQRGDGPVELLPTPRTSDTNGAGTHGDGGLDLRTAVVEPGQWGKYGGAIARWESATRPAPAPTEPNKNGNLRLSAAFSEWLMGWPAGHVTQVDGISRNDQLRIIGNGVAPQQAQAAIRWLLSVSEAVA